MKNVAPIVKRPSWGAVVLVCKDCSKRSKGGKTKAKALVSTSRAALKRAKPRTRVMTTGCLGLCPKAATAIAFVGSGSTRIVAVRSREQLEEAMPVLSGGAPPAPAEPAAPMPSVIDDGDERSAG